MREDRNVLDLLTADYTFVNERLARHYGIPNIYGSHFRRVTLGPELDYRRGLLGKGSFLSVTWTQNFRTSPVKRGVWVLENILGTPPPEPPPNVPALEDTGGRVGKVLTLREQMTLHRANPTCAGLPQDHGPDRFRARQLRRRRQVARRSRAAKAARRSMRPSKLYDGQQVDGPVGLRQALLRYSPQFVRDVHREDDDLRAGPRASSTPTCRRSASIVRDAAKDNNRFSAIVMGVVKSAQFQMRVKTATSAVQLAVANLATRRRTMFVTKKHIPRRTFLRGAGVTLALPLLESMVPALTPLRLTAAAPVRRFVGIWHPHGASPGYWSPLQEGKDFDFSFITKPLEPFRNRVVLITGLDMPEAMATDDEPGGDHARGAVLLSGARPRRNAVSPYPRRHDRSARSRNKYGQDTILSSLQLGVEDTGNFGNCNWGYSCAYTNSISWSSPTQPLPTQVNPRVVFERLFGDGTSPEERLARTQAERQHPRFGHARARRLQEAISARATRRALDTYVENIRELERRIRIAMENSVKEPDERRAVRPAGEQARALPADVRPDGAGLRGRHHALGDLHAGPRSDRHQLPGVRLQRRLARLVAPRRQAGERRQLRQDQPLSRAEPRLLLRQAEERFPTATARCSITC